MGRISGHHLSAEHVSHGIEQEVVEQRLLEDGTRAGPGNVLRQWRVDPADQEEDGQARTASLEERQRRQPGAGRMMIEDQAATSQKARLIDQAAGTAAAPHRAAFHFEQELQRVAQGFIGHRQQNRRMNIVHAMSSTRIL